MFIWNMDEMGIIMFYKLGKIIVKRGVKIIYGKVGFWELIMVIVCVNVSGIIILFYFIMLG